MRKRSGVTGDVSVAVPLHFLGRGYFVQVRGDDEKEVASLRAFRALTSVSRLLKECWYHFLALAPKNPVGSGLPN